MHFAELPLQAIDVVALDTFPFPIPLRPRARIPTVFARSGIFNLFYYHASLRGNAYGRWMDIAMMVVFLAYHTRFSTHFDSHT